jgi:hypothetical protein
MSMPQGPESNNPFSSPSNQGFTPNVRVEPDELTAVDWLICILCSGIGCCVGIIRTIQGKETGPKMIGISVIFMLIWAGVRMVLMALRNQ